MTEHEALALAYVAMLDTLAYLTGRCGPFSSEQKRDAQQKLAKALAAAAPHFVRKGETT